MKHLLIAAVLILAVSWPSRPWKVCGRTIVKYLPGFNGPLPFELETGYVEVDEREGVNLFYYFVKSERNPSKDPLLYWIDGGPGCSSFNGLGLNIGPIGFDAESYDGGSTPKLIYREESWTRMSSIVFVDSPAGAGYSYSRAAMEDEWSDTRASDLLLKFIRMWLLEHPEFISNSFYVAGLSYGGKMLPIVTQEIIKGNEAGVAPSINLKGFLVGNPVTTDDQYDEGTKVDFARGMGLISDELYEDTKKSCGVNLVLPRNLRCKKCLDAVKENLAGLRTDNILDPECGFGSPKPGQYPAIDRYLMNLETNPMYSLQIGKKQCREYVFLLSKVWSDNVAVQEALGVSKEWTGNWFRCNRYLTGKYSTNIPSSIPYYFNISSRGIRGLIFSGDHDLTVNFVGTQAWIRSFNSSITSEWRSWFVDGQVSGYTRTYAPQLTYATVKGAGHMAPMYKPKECRVMLERWLSGEDL